jgi:hypothetical protein
MYHRQCDVDSYIKEVMRQDLLESELLRIQTMLLDQTMFPLPDKKDQQAIVAQTNQLFKALLLQVHQTQHNQEKHKRVNKQTVTRRASAFCNLEDGSSGTQDRTQDSHQQGVNHGVGNRVADDVEQESGEKGILRALHQDGGDHLPINENKIRRVFGQLSLSTLESPAEPSPHPTDDYWQDETCPATDLHTQDSQHTRGMAHVI